jgi:hypothetical protein
LKNRNNESEILLWIGDLIREAGHHGHDMTEFGSDGDEILHKLRRAMTPRGFLVMGGKGNMFCLKFVNDKWTVMQFRPLASRTVRPFFV